MAVDPKDLRLLNHGRAPNAAPLAVFPAPPPFSPRKVKFLCSFGGQIIPRPSDGLLRYAGGETRIITFRRDATLAEIMNKMSEILGQTAALRYQLPDVDLDALVSVSNPDDLENMMEEYDKLADSAPDGSAKLRVFLFTPSDAAAASDPSSKPKMDDTAQRYLDAVNGFSSDGSLRRKDSLASVSSTTHNSDGGQIVNEAAAVAAPASADGGNEGTSSAIPSPAFANFDQSRIMFAGTQILNTASAIPIHNVANPDQSGLLFAVAKSPTQALNPPQPEFPPAAHYADQNQAQYANLQPVPNNVASFSARSYIPPAVHVAPLPSVSHVGSVKVDSHMEENTYSGRAAQVHNDPNYKPVYPLLSQLPPLPPTYLQLHNGEWYGLHPAGSPRSQVRVLKMMDCYMCQKGLMHAHSDTVLQENGNGTGSTVSEASGGEPVLQSVHSEDVSRLRAPNQLINELMAERVVESKPENMMPASQFSSYAVPQKPETQHENGRMVVPKAESSDNAVASRPPTTMGLPSASQMSNGLFINIPPTQYEDSQQQQLPEYVGQPHILVRPDLFTTPYGNGVYPVRNVNVYPVEHLSRGSMLESSYGYGRSINGMMESLRVTPYENSGYHENRRPILTTSNIGVVKELKPENPPSVQNCYPVRQHVGGDAAFVGNTFANPAIIPEGNYVRPADQLLPSSAGVTQLQNFQSVIPSQALLLNPEIASEPMVSNGRLHGNPTFSCGFDPAHNSTINNIPIGDWKDETSQQLKDMTTELGGTPSVTVSIPPSSSGTNGHVKLVQEHVPSDPPLYNQDPMKILVSTSMLPPLPLKVASKESVIPKDMSTENLLISTNFPDVAVVIDQPSNSVIKESCLEHPVRATRGSGDEHIKQELQALAEGVASSVLQASVTSAPTFVAREMKDPKTQPNKEWGVIDDSENSHSAAALGDPRIEEIKTKRIDKESNGFPIGDEIEIGRLQVINNTDLEELRELGSGTFGTVYHGKWRGSDVAIKRINDRCFAGKPSEQERMRADFWNEACNLADLHHPNVVAFYGVVLDGPGGSVATVTEYMANGSLRHALQKNDKTLDQRKRLLIAMDVAFGMEYLHGKNIVHFDLKSDNLLVNLRDPQCPICKALSHQEKSDDAKRCLEVACGILEKEEVSPSQVLEAYNEVAALYESMNEFEPAISLLKMSLGIAEKLPQEQHVEGTVLARIGWLLLLTGKVEEAVPYMESAADRMKESFGPKHVTVGYIYNNLGAAYMELERPQSAVQMFAFAKDIMEVAMGPHHRDSIEACQSLANAYSAMRRCMFSLDIAHVDELDELIRRQEFGEMFINIPPTQYEDSPLSKSGGRFSTQEKGENKLVLEI